MQSKRIDKAIRLFGFWSELVGELRSWGGGGFQMINFSDRVGNS